MGCGAAMGTGCKQCLVVVLTAGGTAFAVTLAARTTGVLRASEISDVSTAGAFVTAMMPDDGAPEAAEPEDDELPPMSAEQPENETAAKEKAMAAVRARQRLGEKVENIGSGPFERYHGIAHA